MANQHYESLGLKNGSVICSTAILIENGCAMLLTPNMFLLHHFTRSLPIHYFRI